MTDFAIQIRVKNARLLRAIRSRYGTAAACSRATGVSQPVLGQLLAMKVSPLTKKGEWRPMVITLTEHLNINPDVVWPERLRDFTIKNPTAELELSAPQVESLMGQAADPILQLEQRDILSKLAASITPRQLDFIMRHQAGETPDEIAESEGVGRARVHQIINKGLKRMREKAHRMRLDSMDDISA